MKTFLWVISTFVCVAVLGPVVGPYVGLAQRIEACETTPPGTSLTVRFLFTVRLHFDTLTPQSLFFGRSCETLYYNGIAN